MPKKKTYEEVKLNIEATNSGTVLLSTKYEGTKMPLEFKCKCGKTFKRTYDKFMAGAYYCVECKKSMLSEMYKFSLDEVKQIIREGGCEYVSGEYVNNQSILTIRCSCGNLFEKKLLKFRSGQNRCPKCGSEFYKGTNSHCYKDGRSLAYYAMREVLMKWRAEVRKAYNDTCPITGENGDQCEVHHIKAFKSIYKPIMDEYGIELNNKTRISDFPSYQAFDDARRQIAEAHTISIGILISKKIHYAYHSIYKGEECNEENFADFLLKNYGIELSQIRRCEDAQNGRIARETC
jgi:Zn finger protein HypA/HybF involved in hydrogenase expression